MTDEVWDEFVSGQRSLSDYLFLEPHKQLVRQWEVKSEDATFHAKMDGAISRFGAVSVLSYDEFAQAAAEQGYKPLFMDDPSDAFAWLESLNQNPGVSVNSRLEGRVNRNGEPLRLINGFLPFQAVGVNYMRSAERAVYGQWSTGTGKTLLAEAAIMVKRESGYGPQKDKGYDLTIYACKPNNLFNAQRKLKEHTGLDATILNGTPKKREKIFAEVAASMLRGEQPILIMTCEKFREDKDFLMLLVEDKDVLFIFDEMPSKYRNRMTSLYRATAEVLYKSFVVPSSGKSKGKKVFYPKVGEDRPRGVFYVALSATPIYNSPEDLFNTVRLMDSRIFGSINDFNNLFVARRDDWGNVVQWKNLDLMGAMCSHIVHLADKNTNPEIAAQFPEKLPHETIWCDMDSATERLYGKLQSEYSDIRNSALLDFDEILSAIGCLQMLCDNPRSVLISAQNWEDYLQARNQFLLTNPTADELKSWEKKNQKGSEVAYKFRKTVGDDAKFTDSDKNGECTATKMVQLRAKIEAHDDKAIVFSTKDETLLPLIAEWFDKWGITYVTYSGALSDKQKQEAQDKFRTDPSVKVFLSTDAGQDSIDLPEASLTIHYNDPWTKATKVQRGNRQDRIDSVKTAVQEATLAVPGTVEDRKAEILATKAGYQKTVQGEIVEQAEEMQKSDFLYMLTGAR